MDVQSVQAFGRGAGSLTYLAVCQDEKYVVKYPADNGMNYIDEEPKICSYLLSKGICVCDFILNKNGSAVSMDENGRKYHVQKYIEGKIYDYHTAPT